MLIGVDFDNTIVCYDDIFHCTAVDRGLIPAELPRSKEQIRDYLRAADREEEWTLLQGYVYGVAIAAAPSFAGVLEFFSACREREVELRIISHRTRHPFRGPKYDLHLAAENWLKSNRFFDQSVTSLRPEQAYFEETKQGKLERIAELGCTHFIDDLPELLTAPEFPPRVRRILFDPNSSGLPEQDFDRVGSWREVAALLH